MANGIELNEVQQEYTLHKGLYYLMTKTVLRAMPAIVSDLVFDVPPISTVKWRLGQVLVSTFRLEELGRPST